MIEVIEIKDKPESELETSELALLSESHRLIALSDDADRDVAIDVAARIKRAIERVGVEYDEDIDRLHKSHKSLCAKRNRWLIPLKDRYDSVKRAIGTYEDAKRREIEAKRQAELAEQRRVAEEAERKRQEAIAAERRAIEDRRIAEAVALEAAGKSAEADKLIAAPVTCVPPPRLVVAPPPPMTTAYKAPVGTKTQTHWKFDVTDESLIPREFLTPDMVKIGQQVRIDKDKTNIPGVTPYPDTKASIR